MSRYAGVVRVILAERWEFWCELTDADLRTLPWSPRLAVAVTRGLHHGYHVQVPLLAYPRLQRAATVLSEVLAAYGLSPPDADVILRVVLHLLGRLTLPGLDYLLASPGARESLLGAWGEVYEGIMYPSRARRYPGPSR